MSSPSLIVVDDDPSIREALADYLNRHGFDVRVAENGAALDAALSCAPAHLVILDLMMPGEDGLSICRRLAGGGIPILMLSAMGATPDRIVGLEVGAADYLPKPFEPRELLARVRAVLRTRRASEEECGRSDTEELSFDGWRLNRTERILRNPHGCRIALTAGEFSLLQVFAERPGRLLSRDALLDLSRGPHADPFDRVIDLTVSRLRRKLAVGGGGGLIETVRGEGYRFTPLSSGR
jgi:two-component system OmpR family response regulator